MNDLEKKQEDILFQLKRLDGLVTKRRVFTRELNTNIDINDRTVQGVLADASLGSNPSSPIRSIRPVLVKKPSPQSSSLPATHSSSKSQDRSKTCVSVILRSRRKSDRTTRLNMIREYQREVEKLVSQYSLKFCHRSSPGMQVRIDCGFLHSDQAREFSRLVKNLSQSNTSFTPVYCLLISEEELGYHHEPVLTEHDLLAIQSPELCWNIFRTSVLINVKMKNDVVVYEFRNVSDVNKFLSDKTSSRNTMSLGLLRKNVVPKMITTDNKGFYRLIGDGSKICGNTGKRHGFTVDGPFLLFRNKRKMFAFLVSKDASELEHLQFYEENIKDPSREELAASYDGPKVDRTDDDILFSSYKPSKEENLKISGDSDKQVEGISELGRSVRTVDEESLLARSLLDQRDEEIISLKKKLLLINEESLLARSLLDQRDEEIISLKKKLLLMERMILTDIMDKTAALTV